MRHRTGPIVQHRREPRGRRFREVSKSPCLSVDLHAVAQLQSSPGEARVLQREPAWQFPGLFLSYRLQREVAGEILLRWHQPSFEPPLRPSQPLHPGTNLLSTSLDLGGTLTWTYSRPTIPDSHLCRHRTSCGDSRKRHSTVKRGNSHR